MAEKENLSALFDGDDIDPAMIEALEHDTFMQDAWRSFSVTRDVLRNDTPQSLEWDIASRVALALDDEPAHSLTPAPLLTDQAPPAIARKTMPAWLQQITQVGIAASVAMAAIFGVQHYYGADPYSQDDSIMQPPVLLTVPLQGTAEPVSLTPHEMVSVPSEAQVMEQSRRINAVLSDYELQLRINTNQISHSESNGLMKEELMDNSSLNTSPMDKSIGH